MDMQDDDVINSEDDDDTVCKLCGSAWRPTKGKRVQIWRVCQLCDKYVWPKCQPKNLYIDENFFCKECSWHLE